MSAGHRITILTDANSWMEDRLPALLHDLQSCGHVVRLATRPADIDEGDFLFCLSSTRLLPPDVLARNRHNLVVHQSDLPEGRGWSPVAWQILQGKNRIPVCLFEAAPDVDAGPIYLRDEMRLRGTELIDEIRSEQAACGFRMVKRFLADYPAVVDGAEEQRGKPTYFPRRGQDANRLDPDKSLRDQFNLLRIADNERYPCYFELDGEIYVLKIENGRWPLASRLESNVAESRGS